MAPVDFDYTAISTSSWAVGAMVTTAADLHTLLGALFDEQLVSAPSLAVMTGAGEDGFSVFIPPTDEGFYWHGGTIAGYVSLVAHVPDTGTTVCMFVTNDRFYGRIETIVENLFEAMRLTTTP